MATQPPDIFDVTIIGGGPAGLFGAFYAGLRHMKTKIIDSLDELGGQLTTLYPEKYVYDVAGFPKILARDLATSLIEQAMQYSPTLALGETVRTLTQENVDTPRGQDAEAPETGIHVITTDKAKHYTRTIVICAGAGAFQPKKLNLPEAEMFHERGVYYAVRSKAVFEGHRVLVIGGGDSAIDWAMNLQESAKHITLIHRRNQFRAHEDSVGKLLASPAHVLTFWELKGLESADGKKVTAAVIQNNQTKELRTLPIDSVLVQVGFASSLGALKDWPLKITGASIHVNQHMETSLPGVFAAGDVAAYDGKLKLIATGFGEVAVAVNFAKTRVDPKAKAFPGHSSEMAPHQAMVTVNPPTAGL